MTQPPASLSAAGAVADAVLYEGYLLYPYRTSAVKNQLRWQFGVLMPPAYAALGTGERAVARTECLLEPEPGARLHVRVRFLQLETRHTGQGPWDEAVPHQVDAVVGMDADGADGGIVAGTHTVPLRMPGGASSGGERRRYPVTGQLRLTAVPVPGPSPLLRVCAELANTGDWGTTAEDTGDGHTGDGDTGDGDTVDGGRPAALRRALVACHVLFAAEHGRFLSMVDPPEWAAPAVAQCRNDGLWPVLVGDADRRDAVLAAPVILYDFPQVAPESPGDMFDSTEIDELLSLRTLTLTDQEKQEVRETDPRAAALLDRVEHLPPELWERLHGAIRSVHPDPGSRAAAPVEIDGQQVGAGSRVRLVPGRRRTDAQDMFLVGRTATVAKVLRDVDGGCYLAVTVDDDPGADLYAENSRFRYFAPDEVAPLPAGDDTAADRPRVLIAGIGNIFLGDDGFGVALARRLAETTLPAGAQVADYGISGVHLAYDLLGGYDATILLDALPPGEEPGTLTVLEIGAQDAAATVEAPAGGQATGEGFVDAHGMQPDQVLALLRVLGGDAGRVLVVGCVPANTGHGIGLSAPVTDAVERAVPLVQDLVARQLTLPPPGGEGPYGPGDREGQEEGDEDASTGDAGDGGGRGDDRGQVVAGSQAVSRDPADVTASGATA